MPESTLATVQVSVSALNGALERYRIVKQVGHGAMGIVFEAQQTGLGRRVALKLLPPHLAMRTRTVKRFLREAEAMGRLGHANIVDVYEIGSVKEFHYFTMRFVEGPPLDRVLKAGPLSISDVLSIGMDVASALAHAHSRGVLHRDVKPGNLLRDGERVVLTDFGLARPMDSDDGGTVTESGDLVGTPLYMAPEQISGEWGRIDGRADVWGLGVTLYELLAQRAPFSGANASGILHAILHRDPARLRTLRPDVPQDLESVIHKCLEKDPERRYPTAAALLQDLIAVRDGRSVTARRPRITDPATRWLRRHPVQAGVVAASMLAMAVLGLFGWSVYRLYTSSQGQTEQQKQRADVAEQQREEIHKAHGEANARQAIAAIRMSWSEARSAGDEAGCHAAEQEIFDVLRTDALNELPQVRAEALELATEWTRARGLTTEEVLLALEPWLGRMDSIEALGYRAAVLTGLGEDERALAVHRQRVNMQPRDPQPWLDAAKVERSLGLAALDRSELVDAERHLRRAVSFFGNALNLAAGRGDRELAIQSLIERARTWIDLVQPSFALADLDRALQQDPTRVNAQALRLAAQRQLGAQRGWAAGLAHDRTPRTAPVRPIEAVAPEPGPGPEPAAAESERGLKPLFRAFQRLLQGAQPESQPTDTDPPRDG